MDSQSTKTSWDARTRRIAMSGLTMWRCMIPVTLPIRRVQRHRRLRGCAQWNWWSAHWRSLLVYSSSISRAIKDLVCRLCTSPWPICVICIPLTTNTQQTHLRDLYSPNYQYIYDTYHLLHIPTPNTPATHLTCYSLTATEDRFTSWSFWLQTSTLTWHGLQN